MVLNLCTLPDDALYLYQLSRKYLKEFQSYREDAVCILKFSKGHISVYSVDGVMALVLSMLSDGDLYLYQVLSKYLIGFQSYGHSRVDVSVVANVDGRTYARTNGQKTGFLYCAMPEAGATKMDRSL